MISSCDDIEDSELYFVGDSHVLRWNLKESFPEYITHNEGKMLSDLSYLKEKKNSYIGKDVVVFTGSYDMYRACEIGLENYADEYISAVDSMKAANAYILSVVPKNSEADNYEKTLNDSIPVLNYLLRKRIDAHKNMEYVDIYKVLVDDEGDLKAEFAYDGNNLNEIAYININYCVRSKVTK